MPQLEQYETFASQIFWLIVTFVPLYLVLWKVALPRISATLENRQQRIENDLARAQELTSEAEGVLAAYEEELTAARARAHDDLNAAAGKAAVASDARNAELTSRLATEARAAQTRIAAARDAAMGSISSVATDIAAAATARLIDVRPDEDAASRAVETALKERG
jgi:F-type H+-transporting ATPase subunit b